jgi:hypothetical protein
MPNAAQSMWQSVYQAIPSATQLRQAIPDALIPSGADVINGVQALPGLVSNNWAQVTGLSPAQPKTLTAQQVCELNDKSMTALTNPVLSVLIPEQVQSAQWQLVAQRQQALLNHLVSVTGQQAARIDLSA